MIDKLSQVPVGDTAFLIEKQLNNKGEFLGATFRRHIRVTGVQAFPNHNNLAIEIQDLASKTREIVLGNRLVYLKAARWTYTPAHSRVTYNDNCDSQFQK